MASPKEAVVYIIDVGKSMDRTANGRDQSDLDWAMQYIWDKIGTVVGSARKTLFQSVILARTDGTHNELARAENEGYEHITVIQKLGQLFMTDVRKIHKSVRSSATDDGDIISAIVLAITSIETFCKKLKYDRQIVVVTNGTGEIDTEEMDEQIKQISVKLKKEQIHLTVLGVDFDDDQYGFREVNKPKNKALNEEYLRQLTIRSDGTFGTLAEAISQLDIPTVKQVKPVHSYKGKLTLGKSDKPTTVSIDVERYPCIKQAKPVSSSAFAFDSNKNGPDLRPEETPSDMPVKNERSYRVEDSTQRKGYREVEFEQLEKGYEYGRTAVPISKADENVTKLETTAGYEILGFIEAEKYKRYLHTTDTSYTIASKVNEQSAMALSSLIHALFEMNAYAIARLVTKEGRQPVIILLAPLIDPDRECLVDVCLPFAEDIRRLRFPPLDKIITITGKTLTEHRNLPNAKLQDAMDAYVDSMDLSEYSKDEDGKPTEYATMQETYNPYIHRLNAAISHRAIHPGAPLPELAPILTRYSHPPASLIESSQLSLSALITAADVKKVPPKAKGRHLRDRRAAEKPISGLDVDSLLAAGSSTQKDGSKAAPQKLRIDPSNAVPSFKRMLDTTTDPKGMSDASAQMLEIICNLVKGSFGDAKYGAAMECLRVMREELVDLEEPDLYNEKVQTLKSKMLAGELGGDRRDAWYELRRERLGLVGRKESSSSKVGEEEVRAFFSTR